MEGLTVSANFNSPEPSVFAVYREAWPLRSNLLRSSLVLKGRRLGPGDEPHDRRADWGRAGRGARQAYFARREANGGRPGSAERPGLGKASTACAFACSA